MGTTTFSGPVRSTNGFEGDVTGNVTGDLTGAAKLPTYTVATAPSAETAGAGTIIYVSDGLAGAPTVAVSDGTDWISAAGTAIAAA
jgi:hypothetical protein